MFPACLVSTIFVAQNAVCNGFGCGLGGRAGEHHEHQLGVCGPMGGLRWAVFRAPQYERAYIADIKHQSCRYCCRTWFWGRFEAVPMAPKHEKGNTTGDHDAADARVRRARARARALYASISSISVLDFCYAGSIVLCRSERARARPGGPAYALYGSARFLQCGGERQSERRRPCRPLPPGPTIKLF